MRRSTKKLFNFSRKTSNQFKLDSRAGSTQMFVSLLFQSQDALRLPYETISLDESISAQTIVVWSLL